MATAYSPIALSRRSPQPKLDAGQHLREHERRRRALEHPGRDQRRHVGREPGGAGGDSERGDAQQEQPLVAVGLAEPGPGEQHGVDDEVAADDELRVTARCAEIRTNRRSGHIGDGGVGRGQERRGKQHAEQR
jgi:hypothetical protein